MENSNFMLNNLLGLTKEEIENSKIALNMTSNGEDCIKIWKRNNDDIDFSYWSHQGEWKGPGTRKPNRNYLEGKIVFGFVRLENDRWLLVTVGKIIKVPEVTIENPRGDYCTYEIIEKYRPLFGRLIIKLEKGNAFSRYAFNMETFINKSIIEQILPLKYGKDPFPGYGALNINFDDLKSQIENLDWKSKLSSVKGIYLITDKSNNKKYVGSAYGTNGLYGRWRTYLNNGYDKDEEESGKKFPNSQLKEIAVDKSRGISHIKKYFSFSILETLPNNFSIEEVIARENHWKEVLNTRDPNYGYNSN